MRYQVFMRHFFF